MIREDMNTAVLDKKDPMLQMFGGVVNLYRIYTETLVAYGKITLKALSQVD